MSKQPQLPVAETIKKKLTAEQKVRLNQLIEAFANKGDVLNFYPRHQNPKPIDTSHEDYDEKIGKLVQEFRDSLPKEIVDPVTEFGITLEDIPILAVIINSDKLYHHREEAYGFAVLHAAVALSALQQPATVPLLINQLYKATKFNDDYSIELFPMLISSFGQSAIEPLIQANELCKDDLVKSLINQAIQASATHDPSVLTQVKTYLVEQLQNYAKQSEFYNSTLISNMADLGMVEQLPLIAEVYRHKKIDPTYMGDMEDIEIEFGVRTKRDTPRPKYRPNDEKLADRQTMLYSLLEQLGQDDEKDFQPKPLVKGIQRHF